MKHLNLVLLFSLFLMVTISCNRKQEVQENNYDLSQKEGLKTQKGYAKLFFDMDTYNDEINSSLGVQLVPYNFDNLPLLREEIAQDSVNLKKSRIWKWLCDRWKKVAVVTSDAIGAVIGSAFGPAGAIVVAPVASAGVASALGGGVHTSLNANGENVTTIEIPRSTHVKNIETKNWVSIGEIHNLELAGMYNNNKHTDTYEDLKKEFATKYNMDIESLPKENPIKYTPKEIFSCFNDENVKSIDDIVKRIAEVTHISESKVKFILITSINNVMLSEQKSEKELEEYNINISDLIVKTENIDKNLLINCTSVIVNSNLFWNDEN